MIVALPEKPLEEKIADNSRRLSLQIDCKGQPLTGEQSANLMGIIAAQYARLAKTEAKAARQRERELKRTVKPTKSVTAKRQKTVRKSLRKAA